MVSKSCMSLRDLLGLLDLGLWGALGSLILVGLSKSLNGKTLNTYNIARSLKTKLF